MSFPPDILKQVEMAFAVIHGEFEIKKIDKVNQLHISMGGGKGLLQPALFNQSIMEIYKSLLTEFADALWKNVKRAIPDEPPSDYDLEKELREYIGFRLKEHYLNDCKDPALKQIEHIYNTNRWYSAYYLSINGKLEFEISVFCNDLKIMKDKKVDQQINVTGTAQIGNHNTLNITNINQTIQTLEQQIKELPLLPEHKTTLQKTVDVLKGFTGFAIDHGEGIIKTAQTLGGQQ